MPTEDIGDWIYPPPRDGALPGLPGLGGGPIYPPPIQDIPEWPAIAPILKPDPDDPIRRQIPIQRPGEPGTAGSLGRQPDEEERIRKERQKSRYETNRDDLIDSLNALSFPELMDLCDEVREIREKENERLRRLFDEIRKGLESR